MMAHDYNSFLDYQAARRRITAKFSQSRGLWIHIIVFLATMSAIWGYGTGNRLWLYPENFIWPTLLGALWSLLLVGHGVLSYLRSPARVNRREEAVEDEMRQFIQQNPDYTTTHQDELFALHRQIDANLQRQAFWFLPLTLFTLVNAVFWLATLLNMGTSFAFQLTAPLAVFVIGGIGLYTAWRERRTSGQDDWIARLPLPHIGLYLFGNLFLGLLAIFRAINMQDHQAIWGWWSVILIAHIIYAIILHPLTQAIKTKRQTADSLLSEAPQTDKAKRHLALADDGELVEIPDEDPRESLLKL